MASAEPVLLDQHARDLAAGDIGHAYCVEAAAGTGKTHLMIQRMLALIERGVDLTTVAAITFTEKAAAELKAKLRDGIEKGRSTDSSPELAAHFSAALEQIDRASISTIHAFAASLLRERPVEAGIDPGFEVLDEFGGQLLFGQVWQAWKCEQLANAPPVLRRLLTLGIKLDSIKALAAKLLANRDLIDARAQLIALPPTKEIWDEVAGYVGKLGALKNECLDDSDGGLQQILELETVVKRTPADELSRERALLFDFKFGRSTGQKGNWKAGVCDQQKAICRNLRDTIEHASERLSPSLSAAVLEWLKGFLGRIEDEKRRRGVLDFQDLLLKARDLVRDSREVRSYFQRRFRYLLVDEFQDTDPLQAELVFFLAEQGAKAVKWSDVEPGLDKLFLVGDPKQSIYRFRRADIRIYKQARKMMETLKERLVISQNFRSSPAVLSAVNKIFQAQMVDDGDLQAGYVPLQAQPGRPDARPGLVLLFPRDDYEPGPMHVYRENEAALIAQFIQHICREPGPVRIFDRSTKQLRVPVFGDVAVLFPVSTDIEYYEAALRARGFPLQVEAGGQFYVRRETQALFSVLEAVDNPEDAIAVVAALRSPFFGLSDEDLFLYRQAGGQLHYLRKNREGFPRMTESLEQLRRWHELRASTSLAGVVDKILDESGALAFFLLLPGGQQAVANLLRIVELARRFEQEPGACLRSLVAMLEDCAASELAETDAVLGDEQENAVKLLTIHRAKGLEFPVVILAGMACLHNKRKDVIVDHAAGRISFQLGNGYKTPDYDDFKSEDDRRGEAEDLRLFYVAATRARDCLVIPKLAPEKTKDSRFLRFYEPMNEYGSKPERTQEDQEGVLLLRAEDMVDGAAAEVIDGVFLHDIGTTAPADELLAPILTERAGWKQQLADLGLGRKPAAGRESISEKEWQARVTAAAMGTAFHHIMQRVELSVDDGPVLDAIIARRAQAEGVDDDVQIARLKDWAKRTLASPWLRRARAAKQVWREMPFCINHQGQVTEGSMDLLFEEAGGLVLVDYKTEDVSPQEIPLRVELHRGQLEVYRDAIKQLTGEHLSEAVLYFVRPGVGQVVTYSSIAVRTSP